MSKIELSILGRYSQPEVNIQQRGTFSNGIQLSFTLVLI